MSLNVIQVTPPNYILTISEGIFKVTTSIHLQVNSKERFNHVKCIA